MKQQPQDTWLCAAVHWAQQVRTRGRAVLFERKRASSSTEVARLAGVSQSAVSRVFRPGASVSDTTRRKVLAAAKTLNYRPNRVASALQSGQSGIVGVVVGGFFNPFHALALEALGPALQCAGRQAMMIQVDGEHGLGDAVARLAGYQLDAVLTSLPVLGARVARGLSQFGVPVVSLVPVRTGRWIRAVVSDNEAIGFRAAAVLHGRGAVRLGYIAGLPDNPVQAVREAGFKRGTAALGLQSPVTAVGDHDYAGGYRAVQALRASGRIPDGLFCFNDLTALGAMDALRMELGLRCPEDVLVVGCDNVPAAAWRTYGLTTFDPEFGQLAAGAVAMIEGGDGAARELVIPSRLVERTSTGRCPAAATSGERSTI